MFNFLNKDTEYVKIVDSTKVLMRELISFFRNIAKELDTKKLEEMMTQIDNPFMVLICGEYNSGKSTFINAILGNNICKIGATPTTDKINIIKKGYSDIEKIKSPIINTMELELDILDNFLIVDTPGTNSIIKEHQEITKEFIHRAELILFVTSADRPFSESERQMLELISTKYGKKIVFILNKIDQKDVHEIDEIVEFIRENSLKMLGLKPKILTVSAKKAFKGVEDGDESLIKESRIKDVVNDISKIHRKNALYLKLDSPISTSLNMIDEVAEQLNIDSEKVSGEAKELNDFIIRLGEYHKSLTEDYKKKIELIKGNFNEIENDIYKIIDSISFFKLLKSKLPFTKSKIKYNFEEQVEDLSRKVNTTLESLTYDVAQDSKKMYEQAHQFINKQIAKYKRDDLYIQTASPDYIETGRNILETLRTSFETDYKHYNLPQASKDIKKSIDDGFSASFIGSVASIGLGGALIAVLPTLVMDITGISLSIVLAVSSLFILPAKKRQAKRVLSEKFSELSNNLTTVTMEKIKADLQKIYSQIEREMKPYRSFVDSEEEILRNNKEKAEKLSKELVNIKTKVENIFKSRWGEI